MYIQIDYQEIEVLGITLKPCFCLNLFKISNRVLTEPRRALQPKDTH